LNTFGLLRLQELLIGLLLEIIFIDDQSPKRSQMTQKGKILAIQKAICTIYDTKKSVLWGAPD
jgi:hypothetical protein